MSFKLETELCDYIMKHSYFLNDGMVKYPDQQDCTLPVDYKAIEEQILSFDVFSDDIWVVTYPKCGTTWTQEMVWMIENNLDYDAAKVDLTTRFPFLEIYGLNQNFAPFLDRSEDKLLDHVRNMSPPRLIKSHLPVGLLPRQMWQVKPKIIYVLREPKDVVVSFYNHYIVVNGYSGSIDKYFEAFMEDQSLYGSYFGNVASFWKLRHQPNILVNTFEEMKDDLAGVIRRTAKFLGKTVPEDQMAKLVDHLHFSNMKDNKFTNKSQLVDVFKNQHGVGKEENFMNKGEVGNYKTKMSADWIEKFNEWIRKEKIKYGLDKDREFPY